MKIKIAINYDDIKKEKVIVLVNLPENKCNKSPRTMFSQHLMIN